MKALFRFDVICDESKIQKTIAVSKEVFLSEESEQTVSHIEFLYQQCKFIKKRWWLMQGLLLAFVCFLLNNSETDFTVRRILGLTGSLFVILIYPEIWKNRSCDALEIECTTFYTLRSIYAARLTLFAGVDMVLLSAFYAGTSLLCRITLWEMLTQFMLPFNVTCCICFRTLYSKRINSQALSLLLCVLWAGAWSVLILNDAVFHAISVPAWVSLLAASVFFMGYTFMDLRIRDLTKEFGDFKAVDHFSYDLRCGVYGLLGVNGAGKTTLMRMLTTLMKPTSGQIIWDGEDIFAMDGRYRNLLGYLPQDFGYYPDFSIYDYLMYIAALKGIRPAVAKQRVKELLKQVGLVKARYKKMKTLSGGMKRRAGIAQAMLNDPKILILDEPTAGLDPSERIRFRNLISELSEDRIVLLSTHIVSDIEYIAGDILLMKDGSLAISGTAEELIDSMPEPVWSCTVPKSRIDACLKAYKVANVKTIPGGAELRIVSKGRPAEDAVRVEPTLEDVFLCYFGERTGDSDGTV